MSKTINLGVIGISPGNGHPYSWSAIFNGYNKDKVHLCSFPVIPEYLSKRRFPENQIPGAVVSHVWTQSLEESSKIAQFANIEHVCENMEDLFECDAILLARDDASDHARMAIPFLKAGIPVFVDKPLALSILDANKMFDACKEPWQLFTCSTLRYAEEFNIKNQTFSEIQFFEATTAGYWKTYGVHIVEAFMRFAPHRGKLVSIQKEILDDSHIVLVKWENVGARFTCTGKQPSSIFVGYNKAGVNEKHVFADSFSSFKSALKEFLEEVVLKNRIPIPKAETLEIIEIIEKGL